MAIQQRQVKNKRNADGTLSNKPGIVYDVSIMYKDAEEKKKCYHKKGFPTQREAQQHEAQMRVNLLNPGYRPVCAKDEKLTLAQYMNNWLDAYAKYNVRPSTYQGYKCNIKNHIIPTIGNIRLVYLTGADLDGLYRELLDDGLALNTVKYVHRTLSVALEHAKKHQTIRENPASNVLTKFKEEAITPAPYTLEQSRSLISAACNTQWELIIVLAVLYGLRRGEVLGLTVNDVDLKKQTLSINKQRNPIPGGDLFSPVKEHASNRILPITDDTKHFFERRIRELKAQKLEHGAEYQNSNLLICKSDGSPYEQTHISRTFNSFLCHIELPHIRFHDLRHTAATNMYQLTGNFFTVGAILGHSLKGIGQSLNIGGLGRNATDRYIDIRTESMQAVLNAYHKAIFQPTKGYAAECPEEARSI